MELYVWLFPILFIVHDMEEIIGFGIWLEKNENMLVKKYPKIHQTYYYYSTEGMAVAVLETLLLSIGVTVLSIKTDFYGIWLGAFVAYGLHLVIHILQSVAIHKYIPAVVTSILCLPITVWIICKSIENCGFSVGDVFLYGVIGIVIVMYNLKFAHYIMGCFTKWMKVQEKEKK